MTSSIIAKKPLLCNLKAPFQTILARHSLKKCNRINDYIKFLPTHPKSLKSLPIIQSTFKGGRPTFLGGVGIFSLANENISTIPWEYHLDSSIWWPSNMVERLLEVIHWSTGLPWYGTLLVYTISIRSILLPLFIKQSRSSALSIQFRPQVQALQQQARMAQQQGRAEEAQKKMLEAMTLMRKKGISPFKVLGMSLAPIPIFMASFFAIRNMTKAPLESLVDQGCLWFTNLTVPDPFYILPIVSAACLFGSIELARKASPAAASSKAMVWVMRGLTLASIPITSFMPSALVVYFTTSNFISCLIQGFLLIPGVKKLLKIPQLAKSVVYERPSRPSFFNLLKGMATSNSDSAPSPTIPTRIYVNKPKIY